MKKFHETIEAKRYRKVTLRYIEELKEIGSSVFLYCPFIKLPRNLPNEEYDKALEETICPNCSFHHSPLCLFALEDRISTLEEEIATGKEERGFLSPAQRKFLEKRSEQKAEK